MIDPYALKRLPGLAAAEPTLCINHVAVYCRASYMETTRPTQLANVVNASVTIFSHSALRLTAMPHGRSVGPDAMLDGLAGGSQPPLDLVHLSRQCFGDQELEVELLALFKAQAPALAAQLTDSAPLGLEARARIAHTLRGSALAIGAWRLASVAARIEDSAPVGGRQSENGEATAELLSAVVEVLTEIERIRG